jgi:hypothetical protein
MLLRRTMPPRLRPPSHNEVEESSVGDRDGSDSPPPPPLSPLSSLSRRQFFGSGSRPFGMRDAFVSHFSVTQYTKCGKLHFGVRCKGSSACFRCGRECNFARERPLVTARIQGSQAGDLQSGQVIPVRIHSLSLSNVKDGANAVNATSTISLFCGIACI